MRIIVLVVCLTLISGTLCLNCLDENGNRVDWFWMYKLGEVVGDYHGYTYAYFDSNSHGEFKINDIRKDTNAATRTVVQLGLYGGKADLTKMAYVFYNDQTYDTADAKRVTNHETDKEGNYFGHAKGLMAFDNTEGFWMMHSVPGFPYNHTLSPNQWIYPRPQSVYAQTFFCVNIKISTVDSISNYLQYYYPYIYDSNLPNFMASSYPNFQSLISRKRKSGMNTFSFTSSGGKAFTAIGKSFDTDSDLYEDYVAPTLKIPLKAETWCGGNFNDANCTASHCKGAKIVNPSGPQKTQSVYSYTVANIYKLYFASNLYFKTDYNHAKWVISYKTQDTNFQPWFCAGDINRQTTQRHRGGGALCMIDSPLWTKLNNFIITDYDKSCEK